MKDEKLQTGITRNLPFRLNKGRHFLCSGNYYSLKTANINDPIEELNKWLKEKVELLNEQKQKTNKKPTKNIHHDRICIETKMWKFDRKTIWASEPNNQNDDQNKADNV